MEPCGDTVTRHDIMRGRAAKLSLARGAVQTDVGLDLGASVRTVHERMCIYVLRLSLV